MQLYLVAPLGALVALALFKLLSMVVRRRQYAGP